MSKFLLAPLITGLLLTGKSGPELRAACTQLLVKKPLLDMLSLNMNLMIRTFALISAFSLFTNLSTAFGRETLVGNTMLLRVLGFAAWFLDGFAFALESLAGRFHGAGDRPAIRRSLILCTWWSLATAILFAGLFFWFDRPLLELLNKHPAMLHQALLRVPELILLLLLGSLAYTLDGLFIGFGEGRLIRNRMVLAFVIGFAPPAWLAIHWHWDQFLWFALIGFMAMRVLTLAEPLRHHQIFYIGDTSRNPTNP